MPAPKGNQNAVWNKGGGRKSTCTPDHAEARGRFPGYAWTMRFCARTGNVVLRDLIQAKFKGAADKTHFDLVLRCAILEATPFARVA
jgi:hypothetical protein